MSLRVDNKVTAVFMYYFTRLISIDHHDHRVGTNARDLDEMIF
jgi:hypothetical protein